jgi:hypothetical protein
LTKRESVRCSRRVAGDYGPGIHRHLPLLNTDLWVRDRAGAAPPLRTQHPNSA